MQSGNHWLGFGPEFKRGTTVWDLASEWGKKKAGDMGAQMIMTAMGGPSAGIAAEVGTELLPNMLTHMLKKGGSVQYKEGGGPAWGEDPLFMEWTNLYNDKNLGIIEPNDPRLLELETILMEKYGGQTHVYKNKGGKAKPMYAGEGSYTYPSVNWIPWYGGPQWLLDEEGNESFDPSPVENPSEWEHRGYDKMFPKYRGLYWNKGGDVQHKEHGGMMAGPLSEVKYKKTGGNVSDEITLKMAPLSNKGE